MKRVEIVVPDSIHETLQIIAKARGATVADIVAGQTVVLAREWQRPVSTQVAELHAQKLPNAAIARELGMTNARVGNIIRTLGLVSNPMYPKPTDRSTTP